MSTKIYYINSGNTFANGQCGMPPCPPSMNRWNPFPGGIGNMLCGFPGAFGNMWGNMCNSIGNYWGNIFGAGNANYGTYVNNGITNNISYENPYRGTYGTLTGVANIIDSIGGLFGGYC